MQLGDRNTKFFQIKANLGKKINSIHRIRDDTNNWLTNHEDVSRHFVQDFKKRFSVASPPRPSILQDFINIINPCISIEDNSLLTAQVTDDEILEAVKSIGALKAPGPDGLHASFIRIARRK